MGVDEGGLQVIGINISTKSFELSRASISDPCSLVALGLFFFRFLGPSTSSRARSCSSR